MLKLGVIGGGHILTHRHIPVFKKMKDVEIHAICDQQKSVAKSVAEQFGVKHYYTSLSDMLKEELDIVDICTPPQTHISLAIDAMEAGCHVLVEKPLAMTVKEVDEMYNISRRENVKLCVLHQNLFNPAFQKAKRLVEGDTVGDLISVDVGTFVRRDDYMSVNPEHWSHRLPGGVFFELLPHPVYVLQAFLKNSKPAQVLTKKLNNFSWMKADEARVLVDADNGMGLIVASCNSPFDSDTINIFGTKMSLQVDLYGRYIIKYKPRTVNPFSVGKSNLSLASQFLSIIGTTISNSFTMFSGGVKVSAHYGFLREYINCIKSGNRLPVSEDEARENVEIVETICEGIDTNISNSK